MNNGMKKWNVRAHRGGKSIYIGQVWEVNESLARCAALSKFGITEEEMEAAGNDEDRAGDHTNLTPFDDFVVSLALA